jgi:GAF domain-containing protein
VVDESAYLYRIIETIGSGPDLEAILQGVVRLVTEATACHACLVWFVQDGRLVLRSASPPYAHLAGTVHMSADEGLAGWVVRTRRSATIEENALADPRVKYFPELEEDRFQSLVSVPVFGRAGEVIGVIALHAEAPHQFERTDLDFLEHTASLIGGAVENARLYEDATARVALLSTLSRLSQAIASAANEGEVLRVVVDGLRDLLHARRAEIHLVAPDGRLRLCAARPERSPTAPLDTSTSWTLVFDARATAEERAGLARTLWPEDPGGWPAFAPLVAGAERLGLLAASMPEQVLDADTALAAVAAHTAVAIKQHQAIERLTEENLLKDFFRSLSRADAPAEGTVELAARLGCDLDVPHLVLHVVPWRGDASRRATARSGKPSPWSESVRQVGSRLAARFPGVLVDGLERSLRALVPTGEWTADEVAGQVREMDSREPGEGLSIGLSHPCSGVASFARGFEEAESAAEVGGLLRGAPGVTTYDELGPYRYVLRAEDDARDAAQQRLELLVEYDRRRGTQLLDTLEEYLDHRGNVVGTSRELYIHPNTLRQRLGRIERLSGIDLERDDWLSLAVATKVVKLRRMRRSARAEGGKDV